MKYEHPRPNKVSFIMWATEHGTYRGYTGAYRDIANKALSHAWDWVSIQQDEPTKENEQLLKQNCKKYIRSKFRPSPSTYGYFCFSIYFYFMVNNIFNWATRRLVTDLLLQYPNFIKKPTVK